MRYLNLIIKNSSLLSKYAFNQRHTFPKIQKQVKAYVLNVNEQEALLHHHCLRH